jgi:hypothetical protein
MSRTAARLVSIAAAALVTLTMLAGVDRMATAEPPAALLAKMAASHRA